MGAGNGARKVNGKSTAFFQHMWGNKKKSLHENKKREKKDSDNRK